MVKAVCKFDTLVNKENIKNDLVFKEETNYLQKHVKRQANKCF